MSGPNIAYNGLKSGFDIEGLLSCDEVDPEFIAVPPCGLSIGNETSHDLPGFWNRAHLRLTSASASLQNQVMLEDDPTYLISPQVDQNMASAFGLASVMLKHSSDFLVRVLCAPIVPTGDTRKGKAVYTLDPDYTVTLADYHKYRSLLIDFETSMYTFFGRCDNIKHTTCEGWCNTTTRHSNGQSLYWVQISAKYLDYYSADNGHIRASVRKRGRDFNLACTLVHEIAHHVYNARKTTGCHDPDELGMRECLYHPSHPKGEMGRAWEHYFFGCSLFTDEAIRDELGMKCFVVARMLHGNDPTSRLRYVDTDVVLTMFHYPEWEPMVHQVERNEIARNGGTLGLIDELRQMLRRKAEDSEEERTRETRRTAREEVGNQAIQTKILMILQQE